MKTVRVKRAFYGVEKGVRAGQLIEVSDQRAQALEAKRLVEILGDAKEADKPGNKQAPPPNDKQAPTPATKDELEKLTNKQLHELAAVEEIVVESDDNKASLVAKIEAGRAAKG